MKAFLFTYTNTIISNTAVEESTTGILKLNGVDIRWVTW